MSTQSLSRRTFLKLSAGTTGAALLASCASVGAPADVATEGAAPGAASPLTLEFWAGGFEEYVENRIDRYREMAPDVTIEFVTFGWGEITPKLLTASAAGTPPDLVIQDRFKMAGFAGRGGAIPLDDYIEKFDVNPDDYWPATWQETVWLGNVYAMPLQTDGRFIFWNKDIFEEAGLDPDTPPPTHDWEAMIDLAAQLTQTNDQDLVEVMGFVPTQVLANAYGNGGDYVYAWANGVEFMKDERTAWLDNPKLVETLQWEDDIVQAVGGIDKAAEFSAGWPSTAGFSPFGSGNLAMMVHGDWNLANFSQYYPDLNFGMEPWEIRNQPGDSTGFAGGHCYAIPANAEQIDASHDFMHFLMSHESQLLEGIMNQHIPCLIEAALDQELIDSSPFPELRRKANESLQFAHFRPVTPVAGEIHTHWVRPGTARDWVTYGEKTPEQACQDMQEIVQKALDEYWASVGA